MTERSIESVSLRLGDDIAVRRFAEPYPRELFGVN